LAAPQEAIELPGGNVAVVDTGNARLVLLNSKGKLLKAIRSGKQRLRQPYAVAASATSIYLLDAERGSIERYDLAGHFKEELARDPIGEIDRALARPAVYDAGLGARSGAVERPSAGLRPDRVAAAVQAAGGQRGSADLAVGYDDRPAVATRYFLDPRRKSAGDRRHRKSSAGDLGADNLA
jgi:hypothetical protein